MMDLFGGNTALAFEGHMTQVALGIVYCSRRNAILVVQRREAAGGIKWVFPGGKMDSLKDLDPADTAVREVREETGVRVSRSKVFHIGYRVHPITNARMHYYWMTPYFRSNDVSNDAKNAEPHKHVSVEWWSPDRIREEFGGCLAEVVAKRVSILAKVDSSAALAIREQVRSRRALSPPTPAFI